MFKEVVCSPTDLETSLLCEWMACQLPLSMLLLAESREPLDPLAAHAICSGLLVLNHKKRILMFIERHPDLLKYRDIAIAYVCAGGTVNTAPTHVLILPNSKSILPLSLCDFYSALNKKETVRKRLLVSAFRRDTRNLEALLRLITESLITSQEIKDFIEEITDSICGYKELLVKLLAVRVVHASAPYCPLSIRLTSVALSEEKRLDELFRLSVRALDAFPDSEFVYEALGMCYLNRNEFRDARAAFMKGISINEHRGQLYLYCGIAQTMMRDIEKAFVSLETAYAMMPSSYIPGFYIAFECQQMNNFKKAKFYYMKCLEVLGDKYLVNHADIQNTSNTKRSKMLGGEDALPSIQPSDLAIINRAIYCFLYNEDYGEAIKYIELFRIHNLLKVYYYLFTGDLPAANKAIAKCPVDYSWHATMGFILHISDDFEGAAKEYQNCLGLRKISVVDDLMRLVLRNFSSGGGNRVFDFTNALFDSLEYKTRCIIL